METDLNISRKALRLVAVLLLTLVSAGSSAASQTDSVVTPGRPTVIRKILDCRMSLRSNLLYDLAAVPNLGIEVPVSSDWTVGLNLFYAGWRFGSGPTPHYWRIKAGELALRRYFGQEIQTGHHAGIYAQLLSYDLRPGRVGYLSGNSGGRFSIIRVGVWDWNMATLSL